MASINNKTAGAGFFGKGGSGGGGSSTPSPFVPAGFANVSTMNAWNDLAVSPDGLYVYVCGVLSANSHGAIAQVKIADGTVKATCDLGAGVSPQGIAVSPDSSAVYAYDKTAGLTWWKIATSTMSITHTSTLAVAVATSTAQQFDLSPDGSIYAYVSGADAKLYMINTSTYAVTNQTMSHTAGNLTAVCFYNGSNSNVYVAHAGSGAVDLYAIGGAYTSTVSTGAAGTPAFNAMRSGINNTFLIADSGTNKEAVYVSSGTPTLMPVPAVGAIVANTSSQTAIADGGDIFYMQSNGSFYRVSGAGFVDQLLSPYAVLYNGASGIGLLPGSSESVFTLSGVNYPEVWCLPSSFQVATGITPGQSGYVWTARHNEIPIFAAPFSTTGWTGNDTIGGGGTVTITTAVATTTSKIAITSTSATPHAFSVTTKNNGSFVVTGTAADTFDWCILSP